MANLKDLLVAGPSTLLGPTTIAGNLTVSGTIKENDVELSTIYLTREDAADTYVTASLNTSTSTLTIYIP